MNKKIPKMDTFWVLMNILLNFQIDKNSVSVELKASSLQYWDVLVILLV